MRLFDFTIVVIEMAILLSYFSSVFEAKRPLNLWRLLLPVGLIGISTLTGILRLPTYANLTIAFTSALILASLLFDGKFANKIFLVAVYMVVIFFADILATLVITFFGISYHMSGSDNVTYVVGAMLSNIIRFWILMYIGKILSRRIKNLPVSYWIFMFLCPVLSILSLLIFDIYLMQAQSASPFLVFIPAFCILYINFMIFRFFETYSSQIQLRILVERARYEEENYKILQNNEDELRALKHDMKNHVMMLREYLEKQNPETALAHLRNMEQIIECIDSVVYTGNPTVDAAINIGSRKAQAESIKFSVQIAGKAEIKIEPSDICSVLGNAIDNAIDACAFCTSKYIYIELKIIKDILHIHIENPTVIADTNNFSFTTKKDKRNHGYGMKIMKKIVEKYQGSMSHEAKNGVFYLDIMLKNTEQK